MNIHERLKYLREQLHLTTRAFGESINMSGGAITNMEKGLRNVTDRTVLLICEKFHVNEEWLRYGKGSMFLENDNSIISEVAAQYHLSALDQEILKIFCELPEEKRKGFLEFAMNLAKSAASNPVLKKEWDEIAGTPEKEEIVEGPRKIKLVGRNGTRIITLTPEQCEALREENENYIDRSDDPMFD